MTTVRINAAGSTVVGTYEGGAYIDLHFDSADAPAFDCINVWDYAADQPTIANDYRSVYGEMIDWRNAADESLAHDIAAYRESIRR